MQSIPSPPLIWFDGALVPWDRATVHVSAHALHYGSSVFEGIRCYDGARGPAIFRLADHLERLAFSARIYRLALPFDLAELTRACEAVLIANGLREAYLRPIVFRGAGGFGLRPKPDHPVHAAVIAMPWGAYLGEEGLEHGIDVGVVSWQRFAPGSVPAAAKAGGHYLNSQLVVEEAMRHGYAEGIALNREGLLSEGSGENLFLVLKGRLYTPPAAASILLGITRDTVLTLARELGIPTVEQPLPRELLYAADEVFLTGTAAEITPVRAVDGIAVGKGRPGPVTRALQRRFFDLVRGRVEDAHGWLHPLPEPAAREAACR
jgi:branched-chain amino acid aminotransferase